MTKIILFAGMLVALSSPLALAQATSPLVPTEQGVQTYIRMNESAAQSGNPAAQQSMQQMQQNLRDAGHPAARAYDSYQQSKGAPKR